MPRLGSLEQMPLFYGEPFFHKAQPVSTGLRCACARKRTRPLTGPPAGKSYVGSIPQLFPKYKGLPRGNGKDFCPEATYDPLCEKSIVFFLECTLTNRPDAPILKRPVF